MKRRRWDCKTKAKIVLEGLSGRSVVDLCADYQISQVQYYQWRVRKVRWPVCGNVTLDCSRSSGL